jgi:hypothetical protein
MNTDMLFTTQIRDYHNLFAVSKALDEWDQKVGGYLKDDPKNAILESSDDAIAGLKRELIRVFPGWKAEAKFSLLGCYLRQQICELYVAFDRQLKIQGAAVVRKEKDLENSVRNVRLLYLATDPQNLSCTKGAPKVNHVGASLLKHIAEGMQRDASQIELTVFYLGSAKGFYKKCGFSCSWWHSSDCEGTWPVKNRVKFLKAQTLGISVLEEPLFPLPRGSTQKERKDFELQHFQEGVQRICNALDYGVVRSYEPLQREEIAKLYPRLKSVLSFFFNFFTHDEKKELLKRLTLIICRHQASPLPQLRVFHAVKFCHVMSCFISFATKRTEQVFQRITGMIPFV